ncbi:MAG: PEGA domain-containing protein, partial [Myxococcota bacterium]
TTEKPIAEKPAADLRKSKSAKEDRARPKGATGYLSLRSRGAWAEVFLNGKKLGTTPLARVEVPAGVITLQLKSPNGVNETMTVDVPVGEHIQKTIEIR